MTRKYFVLVVLATFVLGCASSDSGTDNNRKTKRGAAIGAVAGAVAGAVIGNQAGGSRTGAAVGAAAGAAIGAAVGHRMDQQEKELREIPGVDVNRPSEGEIDVRLRNDVLFDVDSSELRPESRDTLRALAGNLSRYNDNVVDVEGHTDSTGTAEYNQRLSERRAASVADYLIDQGVQSGNITVYGYGEMRPRASNDNAEGRQLNRRVEIRIRPKSTT